MPTTPSNKSKSKGSSAQDTTPSSRKDVTKLLSEPAKNRVKIVDKNGGRCLVENCDPERAIEYAHVFAKKLEDDDKLMDRVEWYWKMPHKCLNLDTRYNIFAAGASIHRLFDRYSWVLVPEENIVQIYHDKVWSAHHGHTWHTRREDFPDIANGDYKYRFVPIAAAQMRNIAVIRQNHHPPELAPKHFTVHTYPFTTLDVLTSHVHPKFAIFEAGNAMIKKLKITDTEALFSRFPVLQQILDIYQAWTAELPNNTADDPTYDTPDDGDRASDKDSTDTPRTKRKQQQPKEPEASAPAVKVQQAQSSKNKGRQRLHRQPSLFSLSEKSMELYDRSAGKEDWTEDAIQEWSGGCRPLPDIYHAPWVQPKTEIRI